MCAVTAWPVNDPAVIVPVASNVPRFPETPPVWLVSVIVDGLRLTVPSVFHFTVSVRLVVVVPWRLPQSLVSPVPPPFPAPLTTCAPSPVPPEHVVSFGVLVLTLSTSGVVLPVTSPGLIEIFPAVGHVPTLPV